MDITGLVSGDVSLNTWEEGTSLASPGGSLINFIVSNYP